MRSKFDAKFFLKQEKNNFMIDRSISKINFIEIKSVYIVII